MAAAAGKPPPLSPPEGRLEPVDPAVAGVDSDAELVGRASELVRPLLRDPNRAPQVVAQVLSIVEHHHSGFLPPPRQLEAIELLVPGSAAKLLSSVKAEQDHRHSMDRFEMMYAYLGLGAGFFALLACLSLAAYLAMHDKTEVAALFLGVPALGVIGWFIRSRVNQPAGGQVGLPTPEQKGRAKPARKSRG